MNPNLERALLLFQQSRHEMAENELRQALAAEPHDAYAHALLGLCLAKREQFDDATEETRQAIHLAPDFAFAHYAHASVLDDRNRFSEALTAINEAIRLEPEDADYHALLAGIHFQERRWNDSLNAAEQGLQFNPEHIGCTNLRAMAMVKLGRKDEAGRTIDAALAKNPDNAHTHANQGWTLLHAGDAKKAAEHFREALRLDPQNEWARQGIIEALKARNFIYALMLKYFLWMSRLSSGAQWGIILGGYFGNKMLGALAQSKPELAPWILPLRILYLAFALMTWLAYPFFTLLLRLNKFGRLCLSREETTASNWFGLCLLLALSGLGVCVFKGFQMPWLAMPLVYALLLIPVSLVYRCHSGWPRTTMAVIAITLAVLGKIGLLLLVLHIGEPNGAYGIIGLFVMGAIATMWIGNVLVMKRPQR